MTRSVTGRVPTEERETKASWMAGQAPAKNRSGERPCSLQQHRVDDEQHQREPT